MLPTDNIWKLKDAEFEALLDSDALKPQSSTIRFYAPTFMYYRTKHFCACTNEFPTVSVTGNTCALNCRHCGGKVLETMHPALSPKMLFDLGQKLKTDGAKGALVSGGCLPDGSVPIDDFAPVLARFKHELGLTVFVHTGIVSPKTAALLESAQVDAALIDVIGSQQTIQSALNLNVTVQDYAASLQALHAAGIAVVPHIIVGLNNGKLDGEPQAIRIIQENCRPAAVVIIAFMPIRGTQMANTQPPKPIDIAKTAAAARIAFPKTPLLLGCMRPKGKLRAETDVLALKAGVDGIAFPSDAAIEYAKTSGYKIEFSSYCCAQIYRDCHL
jgi:uncharacterized radical SAM superfamily protein